MLMVIVMLTGDFLSMSLTTDNVRPSQKPNAWSIGKLTVAGVILGVCLLGFCTPSWPWPNSSASGKRRASNGCLYRTGLW